MTAIDPAQTVLLYQSIIKQFLAGFF